MSYKVEELLALRDSVSESAVSIDKFADEDVIKGQWLCLRLRSDICHLSPHFALSAPAERVARGTKRR